MLPGLTAASIWIANKSAEAYVGGIDVIVNVIIVILVDIISRKLE